MYPSNLLVVVEVADGRAIRLVHEMLGLARELTARSDGKIHACALGSGLDGIGEDLIAHGADCAYVVDEPFLNTYQGDAWLPDLVATINEIQPDAVLVGHTLLGADLAPRLAFRLGTTVATGCSNVEVSGGKLHLSRPCYGGKAEEVVSLVTRPAVFTVRARCFDPRPAQGDAGKIVPLRSVLNRESVRTRVREFHRDTVTGNRLESARVVVAGGGGMNGAQGFDLAGRLADLLGGAVGASRVACDLGWCPPSLQVGLSGKTVAPELYMAIGISGSGQHMAGCVNAKTIVAINTDREAPIFRYAKYGIVGDCHKIMPALIETIESRRI